MTTTDTETAPPLTDWQRGYLAALDVAEDLEQTILAFAEAELARKDPATGEHTASVARKARWRARNRTLCARIESEFERQRTRSLVKVGPGRSYRLPESPEYGEEIEHATSEWLRSEVWT